MGTDIVQRVARRFLAEEYAPDPTAPAKGEWDRSGDVPRWRQDHRALVIKAMHSWKGSPTDMVIAMEDERDGRPVPASGSGKMMRAQAAALAWEFKHKAKKAPPLFRGSHEQPKGYQPWSSNREVADLWAAKNHGQVFTLEHAKGLRIADYLGSDPEREWIVLT